MLNKVGVFNLTFSHLHLHSYMEYFIRKLTPNLDLPRHKQMIALLFMAVSDPHMIEDGYTGSADGIKSLF